MNKEECCIEFINELKSDFLPQFLKENKKEYINKRDVINDFYIFVSENLLI